MKTIRVDNGDIYVGEGSGSLQYTSGIEKSSQDVARHLLSEYSAYFQEGNELLTEGVGQAAIISEGVIQQFLTEAINRLIVKQRELMDEERIIKINQIQTRIVDFSSIVFMVEVMYSSGETSAVVDVISIRPTALNQVLDPSGLISI